MRSSRKYVVDTSVVVERIIKSSPYKILADRLFDAAVEGAVKLYVTHQTISEVLYTASRVYSLGGVDNPNKEAFSLVLWLGSRAKPVVPDFEMALRAGELKKKLGFSIADCYVIAAAEHVGGEALFLKIEEEMKKKIEELKNLPVKFLQNLSFTE